MARPARVPDQAAFIPPYCPHLNGVTVAPDSDDAAPDSDDAAPDFQ
jgi:hypothetical protein